MQRRRKDELNCADFTFVPSQLKEKKVKKEFNLDPQATNGKRR
jgi:hypothetical protein